MKIQIISLDLNCQINDGLKIKIMNKLQKQANKAPKFILIAFNPETGGYVFPSSASETTTTKSKAMKFSYEFDDETMKERAWSAATGLDFMALAV